MIVGTGVDLERVDRIRAAIERHGRRFLERVFTAGEIDYVEGRARRAASYPNFRSSGVFHRPSC